MTTLNCLPDLVIYLNNGEAFLNNLVVSLNNSTFHFLIIRHSVLLRSVSIIHFKLYMYVINSTSVIKYQYKTEKHKKEVRNNVDNK